MFAETGAPFAKAVVDAKQGTMSATLYVLLSMIEKLVGLPFEADAGVGAMIFIGKIFSTRSYNEQRKCVRWVNR